MTKTKIREQIREKRPALTPAYIREKSLRMTEDIIRSDAYRNSRILYIYFPVNNEIDTNYLIAHALKEEKTVAVPVCISSDDMVFERIDKSRTFHDNRYRIMEPSYDPSLVIDGEGLMIVPMVAYKEKHRVGYGRHFYNNYLHGRNYVHTIAVGYDFQEIKEGFDVTDQDVPMSEIRCY